ncbi:MAG: 3,4-dehydroadipyl-CoA semialdehyde dehydrogenase [Bradymonadia bacterium]
MKLTSYLNGAWQAGNGQGVTLINPTTGAELATASAEGLDLAGALAHARDVGGPALRAMSFTERGEMLKGLSKAIHEHRDALIELATANGGNTRGDAKFDIDGCTGTLMAYAGLGAELGDKGHLADGDPVNLTRSARVQGQHIRVPRRGAAVHINAFNFPAWGMGEKMACALLAGMPVVSKPAPGTALLAHRVAEIIVESGLVPEGGFTFIAGDAHDLLDHVNWQDVVSFTGGSATAAKLRGHASLIAAGCPLNVEADSLNAAVLGPEADEETYDAFIRDVHKEMTQKAGQKCTAVRRILVPADRIDEVIEDLGDRLSRTVVGDPSQEGVHMGPLSSPLQKLRAQEGIAALKGACSVAWTSEAALEGVADESKGAFVRPHLMRCDAPETAPVVHELEVFGPVATVMPYDGTADAAVALVRKGAGGLVNSLYADNRKFLAAAMVGLADTCGRLYVVDAKTAAKGFGSGAVLPTLIHGGPGRAGAGCELGGVRGLEFYTQRCVVQGNGPLIARLLG